MYTDLKLLEVDHTLLKETDMCVRLLINKSKYLDRNDKKIIKMIFGIEYAARSKKEIARMFNYSPSTITAIQNRFFQQLRKDPSTKTVICGLYARLVEEENGL